MFRRKFFITALTALIGLRASRAQQPVPQFKRLDTGKEVRAFKLFEGHWVEIPWDDMRPGDEIITICVEDGHLRNLDCFKPSSIPVGASGSVELGEVANPPRIWD